MGVAIEPRTLHLIDIENVLGAPRPTCAHVRTCHEWYRPLIHPTDHVVVAFNHGAFAAVAWEWPGARLLVRSGPDAADNALIDVLTHERVEDRFQAVTLASGDGIFTDHVARLGDWGVSVTVVSRPEALARRLQLAAATILPFELAQGLRHSDGTA